MTEQEIPSVGVEVTPSSSDDFDCLVNGLNSERTTHILHDADLADLRDNDSHSLQDHNECYGSILRNYTAHVSKTLKSKRKMKNFFFVTASFIMIGTVLFIATCIVIVMRSVSNEDFSFLDYIVPTVSALISFMTTFIVIPKIIAEYLFNSSEDAVMKDIVSSIQDYDKTIRSSLHKSLLNSDINIETDTSEEDDTR